MTRYSSHMRVAHEKGMTLERYINSVSHLEHQMWVVWLNQQWNAPGRLEWYVMALTAEVRQFRYGFSHKNPPTVEPRHAHLRFLTEEGQGLGGAGAAGLDRGEEDDDGGQPDAGELQP